MEPAEVSRALLQPDHELVRDVPDTLIMFSLEYSRVAEGLLGAGAFQPPGRDFSHGACNARFASTV